MSRPGTTKLLPILLLLASGALLAASGEWAGSEVTEGGKLSVKNPGRPIEAPTTLELKKLWEIGGEDEDEEEIFFGVLTSVDTDEAGNVYLLDAQLSQVFVFSPDGEYLRSIGREGEGPGEFRRAEDLFVTASGVVAVVQRRPGMIVLLTPDGEPAGNYNLPSKDGDFHSLRAAARSGDQVVVQRQRGVRREDRIDLTSSLIRVNGKGEQTADYAEHDESRNFANLSFVEREMGGLDLWTAGRDGRVYLSDDFDRYRIKIWRADGTFDRTVERDYSPRARSDAEKARRAPRVRFGRRGRGRVEAEVEVSDTDRSVVGLFPRKDGTLWALNGRGAYDAPEGSLGTFDVFDAKGRLVRQVTLRGEGDFGEDGFHFVGDRLYVVTDLRSAREAWRGGAEDETEEDDEPAPMSVICYKLPRTAS